MKSERKPKWIIGDVATSSGKIPVVAARLTGSDLWGSVKVRCGFGRSRYRVNPGLYAIGKPGDESLVFVSANYKLSFDKLRSNLGGLDCWILVLDTKGINVWCAAGKGTFGTEELARRIEKSGLEKVVSHRKLILPMLSAPGVSAHEVRRRSGFNVIYGPVRAEDIQIFLDRGKKNTPQMRKVRFSMRDRAVLIPNEFVQFFKYALLLAAFFLLVSGFGPGVYSIDRAGEKGIEYAAIIFLAYLVGMIVPPILLPYLPGRSFSLKGAWVGAASAVVLGYYMRSNPEVFSSDFGSLAWYFMLPAITSFIAMNFTGCSTYTSLSGVKREMRVAVPLQIAFAVVGIGFWVTGLFT